MYRIRIFSCERDFIEGMDNNKDLQFSWRVNSKNFASEILCKSEEEKNTQEKWLRAVLPDGFEYFVEKVG